MQVVYLFLLIAALICFLISAFSTQTVRTNQRPAFRVNLMSLGLACWVLVPLIQIARNL